LSELATWRVLADAVLLAHTAIVAFVVLGLPIIVVGNVRGWPWVNRWWFRLTHAAAIAIVVAESWFGMICPLTTLEAWLRRRAHEAVHEGSFVEYWLQRLIFYDAPAWVFVVAYTVFGLLVAAVWWYFPPDRRR